MSETPKLNQSRILAIGLALLLLPSGIIMATSVGGGGCRSPTICPSNLCQTGIASVTLTATTQGSTLVTYSPAFPSVPNLDVIPQTALAGSIALSTSTQYFQANPTQIWVNMPVAITEIYNDLNGEHRIAVDWTSAIDFRFGIV